MVTLRPTIVVVSVSGYPSDMLHFVPLHTRTDCADLQTGPPEFTPAKRPRVLVAQNVLEGGNGRNRIQNETIRS